MAMPGRKFSSSTGYRYTMNGQEKDEELFEGAMSAEYWEYDARTGRRWNTDPLAYELQSPYVCFNNNPIYFADPLGLKGEGGPKKGDKYDCGDGTYEVFDGKKYDSPKSKKENIVANFMLNNQDDLHSTFDANQQASKSNPSYKVYSVTCLDDAAKIMKDLGQKYNVTTVYLTSHGLAGIPSLEFGWSKIRSAGTVALFADAFKIIGENMAPNGIICVLACGVGREGTNDESIIGNIAKESGRMTFGNRGFTFVQYLPQGIQQAGYPYNHDDFKSKEYKKLYVEEGKWTVARPMLSNPRGYQKFIIGAPNFGIHGLMKFDVYMKWYKTNYPQLKSKYAKAGIKL